jgi:hypothetical protein
MEGKTLGDVKQKLDSVCDYPLYFCSAEADAPKVLQANPFCELGACVEFKYKRRRPQLINSSKDAFWSIPDNEHGQQLEFVNISLLT